MKQGVKGTVDERLYTGEITIMNRKVDIIKDADGNSVVVINDLRFKGRRSVDWKIVEDCLKEYIGQCAEITETSDIVYIGTDFPDEFAHSKDTKELRGANMYAKANSSSIIKEIVEIATNKTFAENYTLYTKAQYRCKIRLVQI